MSFLGSTQVWYILSGSALLTLVSWLRYFFTGNLRVDENYPETVHAVLLFGLALFAVILLLKGLATAKLSTTQVRFSVGAAWALSFWMLPAFSNDLFSLLAYGEAWMLGNDIYADPNWAQNTYWGAYVGSRWKETPAVYGPASLFLAAVPSWLGLQGVPAIFLLKALFMLPFVCLFWLIPVTSANSENYLLVGGAPLLLINGPGQLHNDILVFACILIAWNWAMKGKMGVVGVLAGLAFSVKLSVLLFIPGLLLIGVRSVRHFFSFLLGMLAAVIVPYWALGGGWNSVLQPFLLLQSMPPSGSFTDVLSEVLRVLFSGWQVEVFVDPHEALAHDTATKSTLWAILRPLHFYGWGILALYLGVQMLRSRNNSARVTLYSLAIVVLFITLMSHKFHPWYLIWPLALLPYAGDATVWKRWFLVVGTFAATQDFAQLLPRDTLVFPVWVAFSSFATLIGFLWLFRSRYLRISGQT